MLLRLLRAASALTLLYFSGGGLLLSAPAFMPRARTALVCPGSSPTPTSAPIRLNEVLTNPQTDWNGNHLIDKVSDQWIELFNPSSSAFQMPLQVCDDTAGLVLLPASLAVPANGYTVIYGNQVSPHPFQLSPGGGQLVLLDGSGLYIESVTYPALGPDLSFSRQPGVSGGWNITGTPTPNAANIFTTPGNPTPTATHTPKPTATPRSGKGGSGSGGGATPTTTPVPIGSVVFPTSSALALQPGDPGTASGGNNATSPTVSAWLKIVLLALLGGGLLVVLLWYIRSWSQEPEGHG